MVYVNCIILLMCYAAEPYLWIKSMSLLPRRFEKRMYYVMAAAGYYIAALLKQYICFTQQNNTIDSILSVAMIAYIIGISLVLFKEKLYKCLLGLGLFGFTISCVESLLLAILVYVAKIPIVQIMSFGRINALSTLLSRILLFPAFYFVFFHNNGRIIGVLRHRKENLAFLVTSWFFTVLISMIVRHADLSYSTDLIVLILLAQVVLLLNVFYVISLIGKKDMELVEAEERINELNRIMELTTKLKQLEHDMNTHVAIIGNLVHNRCYTELENYINSIFKDIKIASSICTLPDHAISMMINDLIMKASQKKILFERHLMIEEFYIESKDVCGIISNMVNNAIEATEKLEQERRYISLDIYPAKDGYYITCMNPYDTPVEYFHTTKKKKEEHGLGLGIIKMLTEKNGGVMQIIPNDYNWFEITSFIPVPQTEKSGAKEEKNSIL